MNTDKEILLYFTFSIVFAELDYISLSQMEKTAVL